jgi:hypothetical protein
LNFRKEGGEMKKLSAIAMALALLLMSSPAAYPQARQTTTTPPPVESTLVREGDFATRLVSALEIGMAENETEAETLLASAGIAPKNGWISDYPITPDILGELQETVAAAADSNRLPMGKDEALEVLDSVAVDLGLYVLSYTSGDYAETPPPASLQYTEPTVINNYYYREGLLQGRPACSHLLSSTTRLPLPVCLGSLSLLVCQVFVLWVLHPP